MITKQKIKESTKNLIESNPFLDQQNDDFAYEGIFDKKQQKSEKVVSPTKMATNRRLETSNIFGLNKTQANFGDITHKKNNPIDLQEDVSEKSVRYEKQFWCW